MSKPIIYLPEDKGRFLYAEMLEDIDKVVKRFPDTIGILMIPGYKPLAIRRNGEVCMKGGTELDVLSEGDRLTRHQKLVQDFLKRYKLPRNYKGV